MYFNNNINWWKIGSIIGVGLLIFFLGLYIGKKTTKPKIVTETEYITLPPVHDTIPPIVTTITKPVDTAKLIKQCVKDGIYQELFPEKIVYITDTLDFTSSDSTAIMLDWATKREYQATLFDIDTVGVCKLNTSTQYNRLGNLNYTFTPVQKQTTTTITQYRHLLPYFGVGITTFPSVNAQIGMFIDQSYGFAIQGIYNYDYKNMPGIDKYNFGISLMKMF